MAKKHSENKTGTSKSYNPVKIKKRTILKNMKHGSSLLIWYFLLMFLFSNITLAEEKILSAPLINLDKIQPSFEVSNEENESLISNSSIKEKNTKKINAHAVFDWSR